MSWFNSHDKRPVPPSLMPREVKMPFNRRSLSEQAAEVHDEIERITASEEKYRHHCGYLNEQIQKLQDQLAQMTAARNDAEVKASITKDENSRLKERLEIGIKLFINALDPPAPPAPRQTVKELVDEINHIVKNVEEERSDFNETPPTPEPPIGSVPHATCDHNVPLSDRCPQCEQWANGNDPALSAYAPKPKEEEEMVSVGPPPKNVDNKSKRQWWRDRIGQIPNSYKTATVRWPKRNLRMALTDEELKPIDQALSDVEDYMKGQRVPFDIRERGPNLLDDPDYKVAREGQD